MHVSQHGDRNWGALPAALQHRTPKSCRERWNLFLRPGVRPTQSEPLTPWEIAVIITVSWMAD
jgi:hypothetical protein